MPPWRLTTELPHTCKYVLLICSPLNFLDFWGSNIARVCKMRSSKFQPDWSCVIVHLTKLVAMNKQCLSLMFLYLCLWDCTKESTLIEESDFVQDSLFGARHIPDVAAVVQEQPGEGDRDHQEACGRQLGGCRGRCAEDCVTSERRQV